MAVPKHLKILFKDIMLNVPVKSFNQSKTVSLNEFTSKQLILDEFQDAYVEKAANRAVNNPKGFDTLDGKGGVGKTVTQTKLVQTLLKKGMKVLILAPTHQALNVLRSKINVRSDMVEFQTVAKATRATKSLSYNTGELNFYANQLNLDGAEAVFLDEGSFLDSEEIKAILTTTLINNVRLLVSGDSCQLPKPKSFEISALMDKRKIDNRRNNYITTLEKVYRTEGKGILALSDYIRYSWVIPERRGMKYNTVLKSIINHAANYPEISVFRKTEENMRYVHELLTEKNGNVVYIAYTNKTIDNLARYNIQRQFKQGKANNPYLPKKTLWYTTQPYYIGKEPILQNGQYVYISSNIRTKDKELYGFPYKTIEVEVQTTGRKPKRLYVETIHPNYLDEFNTILNYFDTQAKATQGRKERKKIWAEKNQFTEQFLFIKYAPFFTAHKSQGSEYPVVFIDLQDLTSINAAFVQNRAAYVAFSRAKEKLVILI